MPNGIGCAVAEDGSEDIVYDSEHGIDSLDPKIEAAINERMKKFNQTLKESYLNAERH